MFTFTGEQIHPTGPEFPSLLDITFQLGKIQRMQGSLRIWWSYLHHLILCHDLAASRHGTALRHMKHGRRSLAYVYLLLHDAHVCVIGEISPEWRTKEMEQQQEHILKRIHRSLGIPEEVPEDIKVLINTMEDLATRTEAHCLGSVPHKRYYRTSRYKKKILRNIQYRYGLPSYSVGRGSKLIKLYKNLLETYLRFYREAVTNESIKDNRPTQ